MRKRILKFVGIVLVSVFGFVGITLGVMALMGKFKTPIVYPTVLKFENEREIIVADFSNNSDSKLYSFRLVGENSGEENEVNQTQCQVWIESGRDIFYLCNQDGEKLTPNKSGYYSVDCNSDIYYKLIKDEVEQQDVGKIVLKARTNHDSTNIESQNSKKILVDQKVDTVLFEGATTVVDIGSNQTKQELVISAGISKLVNFEFGKLDNGKLVQDKSKHPISEEGEKQVEFYFNYSTVQFEGTDIEKQDLRLINAQTIKQDIAQNGEKSILSKMFFVDSEDNVYFSATESGTYAFKIAVFRTYADIENQIETTTYEERLEKNKEGMFVQDLNITVVNSVIKSVSSVDNIELNLFEENQIVLNNSELGTGVTNLLLELRNNDGVDSARLGQFSFGGWTYSKVDAKFVSVVDGTNVKTCVQGALGDFATATINCSSFHLSENATLINSIELDGNTYKCTNGVAVLVEENNSKTIKLLDPGAYLEFFVKKEDSVENQYDLAVDRENGEDFGYLISATENTGKDKSWTIIPTIKPANNLSLVTFVVNNTSSTDDLANYDSFVFSIIKVNINETRSTAERKSASKDVAFDLATNSSTILDITDLFNNIDKNLASYDNYVMVAEKRDNDKYNFEVMSKYQFEIEGKSYVVVGYEEGGIFQNKIKSKKVDLTDSDLSNLKSDIYLLQLKNKFVKGEKRKQTLQEIVNEWNEEIDNPDNPVDISSYLNKIFSSDSEKVEINTKYTLSSTNFSVYKITTDEGGNEEEIPVSAEVVLFENTSGHKLAIKQNSGEQTILQNLFYYFNLGTNFADFFEVKNSTNNYLGNILNGAKIQIVGIEHSPVITGEESSEEKIVITFNVGNAFNGDEDKTDQNLTPLYLKMKEVGGTLDIVTIKIKSTKPTQIDLTINGDSKIENLAQESGKIEDNTGYLEVVVGYNSDKEMTQKVYLCVGSEKTLLENIVINNLLATDNTTFKDNDVKSGVVYKIEYSSETNNIFEINKNENVYSFVIKKLGEGILRVNINGREAFVKVNITSVQNENEGFDLNQKNQILKGNSLLLSAIVNYAFKISESEAIDLVSIIGLDDISGVECTDFGGGLVESIRYFTQQKSEDGTITRNAGLYIQENDELKPILTFAYDENQKQVVLNRDNYKQLSLSIKMKISTLYGDLELSLSFVSDITIYHNSSAWKNTLYNGTTLNMLEVLTGVDNTEKEFATSALIRVLSVVSDVRLAYAYGSNRAYSSTNTISSQGRLTLNQIGKLFVKLQIKEGEDNWVDIENSELEFNILPNIVVTDDTSKTLYCGDNSTSLSNLFKLKKYDTSKTFGDDVDSLYYKEDSKGNFVERNNLTDISEYDKNNLTLSKNENLVTATGDAITVGWLEEIGSTKTVEITLEYNRVVFATIDNIHINNNLDVRFVDNTLLEFKAFDNLGSDWVELGKYKGENKTFEKLEGWTLNRIEFVDQNNTQTVNIGEAFPVITAELKNINIKLVFGNGENECFFNTSNQAEKSFNIMPYLPTDKQTTINTGSMVDFVNNIFDIEDEKVKDNTIISIIANDIFESADSTDSKKITTEICEGFAYNVNGLKNDNLVEIKNIVGETKTIYVEYTITYNGGLTYTFRKKLTIKNTDTIIVNYPVQNDNYKLGNNVDFDFSNSGENKDVYLEQYLKSENRFEPIFVSAETERTINFVSEDSILGVKRIVVGEKTKIKSFALVGWQRGVLGFDEFANSIRVENQQAILPPSNLAQGYLVFRCETENGNYAFYTIYAYANNNDKTSYNNNRKASVSFGKISDLVTNDVINSGNYGIDFENNKNYVKFYLLSATVAGLGESEFYSALGLENKSYQDVSDITINSISKFAEIKLALVFDKGVEKYSFGTLTLCFKPTDWSLADESVDTDNQNGLKTIYGDKIQNGYYTQEIACDTLTINSPFAEVTGLEIQRVYEKGKENNSLNSAEIIDISGTNLTINKRVTKDIVIVAKYTIGDVVAFVNYTLKATNIAEKSLFTTGEWNNYESKFDNSILISDIIGSEYRGTISVSGYKDGNVVVKNSDSLEFEQSTTTQQKTLTFTFDNLFDVETKSEKTQTYYITIKSNLYSSFGQSNNNGSSDSQPIQTKIDNSENKFKQLKGSSISIDVDSSGEGYTKFEIKTGETIHHTIIAGHGSSLELKFNDTDKHYVVMIDSATGRQITKDTITISTRTTIEFVHLATTKDIKISATVITNGVNYFDYQNKNLYIQISKTYHNIEAKYKVDQAQHEVVKPNDQIGRDDLLERFAITTKTGQDEEKVVNSESYDLKAMGFNTTGNPNYIEFNASQNATFDSATGKLTFANVNNFETNLLATNKAGAENSYTFKILSAGDSFNFENSSTAIHDKYSSEGNDYISINWQKIKDLSDKKVLVGVLNDINGRVFNLTDLNGSKNISLYYDQNGDYPESFKSYLLDGTDSEPNILLHYDSSNGYVYVEIKSFAVAEMKLTITAQGTTDIVMANVDINIFNYDIQETNNRSYDVQYALSKINLSDKIYALDSNGDKIELTFKPDPENSKYYSFVSNTLGLNGVGSDTNQTITVWVMNKNGIKILKTTYLVTIKRNLQFTVNGQTLTEAGEADSFHTELYLKSNTLSGGIDIKTQVGTTSSDYENSKYYSLIYNLYMKQDPDNASATDESKRIMNPLTQLDFSILSAIDVNGNSINSVSIDLDSANNLKLKFDTDFSGTVQIKVVHKTTGYEVVWDVAVHGLLEVEYTVGENAILYKNSGAWKSGDRINIIGAGNESVTVGTAVNINNRTVSVKATADYKVYDWDGETGNIILFEKDSLSYGKIENTSTSNNSITDQVNNDSTCQINMPDVPISHSGSPISYRVVFKITFEYEGNTYEYYVSYCVTKTMDISVYDYADNGTTYHSNDIIVEDRLVSASGEQSKSGNSWLDLFYFDTDGKTNFYQSGKIASLYSFAVSSQVDFDNFVKSINSVRIVSNDLKKSDEGKSGCYTFKELKTTNNRVLLNLASGTNINDALFENLLNGKLQLLDGNGNVMIETEITLSTNTILKPNNSYSLSSIFNSYSINDNLKNISIIGIGAEMEKDWVNGASGVSTEKTVGTITAGGKEYQIISQEYTANITSVSGAVCATTKTFYAITESITVVDYRAGAYSTNCFFAKYNSEKEEQTFSANGLILTYSMSGNAIVVQSAKLTINSVTYNGEEVNFDNSSSGFTKTADGFAISNSTLKEIAKNTSQTSQTFVVKVVANGVELTFNVMFELPEAE